MTNLEIARATFINHDAEIWHFDAHGFGDQQEIHGRYGYKHGWIVINGESFNRDMAFPEKSFPRFPADQGLSD